MKTITLHNTPEFYKAYLKNWLAHESKNKGANAANLAIISDLCTLVEVAAESMAPKQTNENS